MADGGVLAFIAEPTFFNPILKLAYRTFFGLNKSTRKNRLAFREAYRG